MKIGNINIGIGEKPFVIAEMSGNHNQSLDRAIEIVNAAASAGASALKIQTYTADTMTLNINSGEFHISDSNSLWAGTSLYELYNRAHTPWEWHEAIFSEAKKLGMLAFSSPFDESAVDFLNDLNVPCFKIASFEITDLPLIRKAASTGKPLIISTGMSSVSDINDAVNAARDSGCRELALLKCTSTYPASPDNTNIVTIPHMRDLFGCEVGLSDHTMGIGVAVASVALGATIIEKHFTLKRSDGGVDSAFSLEPKELESLVIEADRARQSLGKVSYGASDSERKSMVFRRSLYFTKDLVKGEMIDDSCVKIIRPGLGLMPKYYEFIRGMRVSKSVKRGQPVTWDELR